MSTQYLDQKHVICWWNFSSPGRSKQIALGNERNVNKSSNFHRFVEEFFLISTIKFGVLAKWLFAADYPPGSASQHVGKQFSRKFIWFYLPCDSPSELIGKLNLFSQLLGGAKNMAAKFIDPQQNEENQAWSRSLCDTFQLEPRACKWTWSCYHFSKRCDNEPSKRKRIDANHSRDSSLISLCKSLERLTRSSGLRSNHFYLSKQSQMLSQSWWKNWLRVEIHFFY